MLSFRSLTNDGGSPDVDISGDKILFVGTMLGMFGYGRGSFSSFKFKVS